MTEEEAVRGAAAEVFRPEGVEVWMNAANPWLNGDTPLRRISDGDAQRVLNVIAALAEGVTG